MPSRRAAGSIGRGQEASHRPTKIVGTTSALCLLERWGFQRLAAPEASSPRFPNHSTQGGSVMSIVNAPGAPGSSQTAATDASTPTLSTASITHVANKKRQPKVMMQASYQALVSGLRATFQPTDTFVLKGGVLTRDQAVAQLGAYIAAGETTKSTRMQWISAVQAERDILEQATPVREGLRNILQARFGKDGTGLTTFGFRPAKAAKKTVTAKATAL